MSIKWIQARSTQLLCGLHWWKGKREDGWMEKGGRVDDLSREYVPASWGVDNQPLAIPERQSRNLKGEVDFFCFLTCLRVQHLHIVSVQSLMQSPPDPLGRARAVGVSSFFFHISHPYMLLLYVCIGLDVMNPWWLNATEQTKLD